MFWTVLGIISFIIGLVGVYSLYDARKNRRVKQLAYDRTGSIPLATASSEEGDYKLSINYERPGEAKEVIDGAYVTYLRFANLGKEPIRRADIAEANPLRVEVRGVRVLDIALTNQRREVTRVQVGRPTINEKQASASLTFDFLDYHDGGTVRVLSTGPTRFLNKDGKTRSRVRLVGDIVGMPGGIVSVDPQTASSLWGKVGVGLVLLAIGAGFAASAYAVKEVTGSWEDAWLVALPFAAVILPLIAALAISERWPSTRRNKIPKDLALPFHGRLYERVFMFDGAYPQEDEGAADDRERDDADLPWE